MNPKDLAVQALSEEAPELVPVLLTGKLSKDFKPKLAGRGPEETFRKLMALDPNQRQPILDTIDMLYETHMERLQSSRGRDKSERPVQRVAGIDTARASRITSSPGSECAP